MIPKEVFHYTKASTALQKILFEKELKLDQLKYMNDPKESRAWTEKTIGILGVITQRTGANYYKAMLEIEREINRIKSEEWKILCVSTNDPKLEKAQLNEMPVIRKNRPFLSGDCKPRMWASYAGERDDKAGKQYKYTGVCLKLRGAELDKQIKEKFKNREKYRVYSRKIQYNNNKFYNPPKWNIDVSQNSKELRQKIYERLIVQRKYYFFLKAEDWKTENEYRWLIHSKEDQPEKISIEGALEEVILGEDISEEHQIGIIKVCRELKVSVGQITWQNGIPKHEFKEIF